MGAKQIFRTALTDVTIYGAGQTTTWDQLGTIRYENNAVYKYVAFSGTTTIAAGDVVCYVAAASDGSEVLVDGANTALGAGVAMAAVASGSVATGNTYYATGWIQIRGLATVSTTVAGSPSIGYPLTTQGESAPACGAMSTTAATLATQQCVGFYYSAKKIVCQFPF